MDPLWFSYPLATAVVLVVLDVLAWQWLPAHWPRRKTLIRLGAFVLFSMALLDGGLSPLYPVPENLSAARHVLATVLLITWWLFGARCVILLLALVLAPRVGGKGHLLQDVFAAIIFLVAGVAAAAYVLELPVKGLLATSGAVAIIVGLAVQSTLGDVFSGIVLNATKPFRVDDWVKLNDIEGKVIEIDWRSTHLLTGEGSLAVIPNAIAAKSMIINFSRPDHYHSVTLPLELSARLRPGLVLDAIDKALKGCRELLAQPRAGAVVVKTGARTVSYEITGYVKSRDRKGAVRNQIYDLIFRQLAASETRQDQLRPATRRAALLNTVTALRMLSEDDLAELERNMRAVTVANGAVVLAENDVPDALYILESGIVSVRVLRGENWIEAGRMGPGELMGETGVVDGSPNLGRFVAYTDCRLYRIGREELEPWLHEHSELRGALAQLMDFRTRARQAVLDAGPAVVEQPTFLRWLRRNVTRWSGGKSGGSPDGS